MCNYPEYSSQNTKNIFIPSSLDRKSKIIVVVNIDVIEKEFELIDSGRKSYILNFSKDCIYTLGDMINLLSDGYSGRSLKTEVTNIHQVDMELHIISFKVIKE